MPKLKLFLISQETNNNYDTYDSFVVCASSKKEARHFNPDSGKFDLPEALDNSRVWGNDWAGALNVNVEEIGIANESQKPGRILGSFNAG